MMFVWKETGQGFTHNLAQSAGAVEYTDFFSAEE